MMEFAVVGIVCDLGTGSQWESQIGAESVGTPVTVEFDYMFRHTRLKGECSAAMPKTVRRVVG